jgi:hypothetical protein
VSDEELELEINKEARFMADKFGLEFMVAKYVLLHGYQMGFKDTRDLILKPNPYSFERHSTREQE